MLRRTNHSLLVLGGDASARARSSDEPLSTVIRAAQGQIEQYDRVELAAIDDVTIHAKAVDDLAKLMAELMDNACRYAPPLRAHDGLPRPDVVVFARLLGDRVNIQVIDEGVGIEPERMQEFNRRMAGRPQLDLTAVRAMGLTVVAELAARHGIGVHLRPGSVRGTVAEITLRDDLFVQGMPAVALVGGIGVSATRHEDGLPANGDRHPAGTAVPGQRPQIAAQPPPHRFAVGGIAIGALTYRLDGSPRRSRRTGLRSTWTDLTSRTTVPDECERRYAPWTTRWSCRSSGRSTRSGSPGPKTTGRGTDGGNR